MRARTLVTIIVIILLATALVTVRMHRVSDKNSAPLIEVQPAVVVVEAVTTSQVQEVRHLLGEVLGHTEVTLAPRVTGRILAVTAREGDHLRRGQLLVRLDAREAKDALAQATARLSSAQIAVEAARVAMQVQHDATARDKLLAEAGAIAQEAWDHSSARDAAAEAQFAVARAQCTAAEESLDSARTRLEYTTLVAPIEGRVAARLAEPGDLATPGKALLKIVPAGAVRIRCRAPAEDLPALTVGGAVTLTQDQVSIPSKISRIFPAMDKEHLSTFEIDLAHPPEGLVAGATVGVDVVVTSARGLTIPVQSLLEGEYGSFVFTVVDDKAHPVAVDPIARSEQRVVVTGALELGQQVVVARPSRLMQLAEGTPLRIAPR